MLKRLLLLVLLVALSVSPAFAQTTRVAEVEAEGVTLNVDIPEGWAVRTNSESVYLASSEAALTELWNDGLITDSAETGVVIYHPVFLRRVNLETDTPSEHVLEAYRSAMVAEGEIEASNTFTVPASFGQFITAAEVELWGLALEFPGGTVLVSMLVGATVPPELNGLLRSVTLSGGESTGQQPETQTAQLTERGLTLAITLPASWVTKTSSNTLMVASSQSALDALNTTGLVKTPGDTGVILYMPSMVADIVTFPDEATPEDVVETYLEKGGIEDDVETLDAMQVPGAAAMITMPSDEDVRALIGALQFPDGIIIFGVVPGDTKEPTMGAILRSITLTGAGSTPPDQSIEIELGDTPTTFAVPNPGGFPLQLSINLPENWANRYSQNNGFIYAGSSEDVLGRIGSSNAGMEPGEIGMTVVLPAALRGLGIQEGDTPEHAIQNFETRVQATGAIHTDDSFGVPAAYAGISGENIPEGGGVVYVIAYETGTILALIQPASAANESVVDLLRSIRFGEVPRATPTPEPQAEPIRQWASRADGSSQYGTDSWSFAQVTGEPDTLECGDNRSAWAGEGSTSREVLRVFFDEPVIPTQINVYQSFNPGAIVEIDVGVSSTDRVLPLPNSADPLGNTECPGVFSLDVSGVTTPVDFVVIYLDQSLTGNWNEIDAVELVGIPAE